MELKKILVYINIILFSVIPTYALQVVDNNAVQQTTTENGLLKTILIVFFGGGALMLFFGFVLFVLVWIMLKIYNKLTSLNRKKKDFLYQDFEMNSNQCHFNRDVTMKRRNPRRLWIFWKRNPIFINTKNKGYEVIGSYNGECQKKESYYMVSIYNKLGWFKMVESIILIPHEIEHIIKRINVNGQKALVLDCEGVDQLGDMDYYYIPLIPDPNKKGEFIDFSDKIHKEYFEKITYRNIIKENLMQYRTNIIQSVESNPNVHFKRRIEK